MNNQYWLLQHIKQPLKATQMELETLSKKVSKTILPVV